MSANLSQAEIALLLRTAGHKEQPGEEQSSEPEPLAGDARPLDLTLHQERIFRGRLPGLELIIEKFSSLARNRLTRTLDRNVFISTKSIESQKFGTFLKKLPLPSSLHLFRMAPLPSQALLSFSTPLVYSLVDVMMGGKGKRPRSQPSREFTAIETRLITKLAAELLEEFQAAWQNTIALQCIYAQSEFNPLAINIVPSTDRVVTVELEFSLDETSDSCCFCLPLQLLQPIHDKLSSGSQAIHRSADEFTKRKVERHVRETSCEVRVILAEGPISVRSLMDLKPGDIIPLSTASDAPAKILVEGKEKFRGTVGSFHGQRSVKLAR